MIPAERYEDYLDCLLAGDSAGCEEVLRDLLLRGSETLELYEELFQRSLYQVGELWERNLVSVAVEHLATAITERLLPLVYERALSSARTGRRILIACAESESHQLGGRIVADLFELQGWDSEFLGAGTSTADLIREVEATRPDVVGLSLSIDSHLRELERTLIALRAGQPELPILLGGQGLRWAGSELSARHPGVTYLPSLGALREWIGERELHAA